MITIFISISTSLLVTHVRRVYASFLVPCRKEKQKGYVGIWLVLLLVWGLPVHAQEKDAAVEVDARFQLFVDAIEVAAHVDAYNGYCGQETQMASDLVGRAKLAGVVAGGGDALRGFGQEHYIYYAEQLKEDGVDCKNVDFLLNKLDVFKKMESLVGRINSSAEERK